MKLKHNVFLKLPSPIVGGGGDHLWASDVGEWKFFSRTIFFVSMYFVSMGFPRHLELKSAKSPFYKVCFKCCTVCGTLVTLLEIVDGDELILDNYYLTIT